MNRLFRHLAVVGLFLTTSASALPARQDSSQSRGGNVIFGDVKSAWEDGTTLVASPVHFSGEDWLKTGAILGGTASLFALDRTGRVWATRGQSSTADNFATAGRDYGNAAYALSLSAALYAGGLAFDSKDVRVTGLLAIESICFSGAITNIFKVAAARSRPYVGKGPFDFHGFKIDDQNASFPSGHSTVAFALSSTLAGRIDNTWGKVLLYSLATLTAVSRVYNDEHWVSDSFLGAAIGQVVGSTLVRYHRNDGEESSFSISPTQRGITAEWRF